MKKVLITVAVIAGSIFLIQCAAGKKSAAKNAKSALLVVAEKRWPGVTQHDLDSGRTIFTTRCTKCHLAKNIADKTEAQWVPILNKMAPMAKLAPEQKELLTRYVLAARSLVVK